MTSTLANAGDETEGGPVSTDTIPPISLQGKARLWSAEDEDNLRVLAGGGVEKEEIARRLGRTVGAVSARLVLLRAVSPTVRRQYPLA